MKKYLIIISLILTTQFLFAQILDELKIEDQTLSADSVKVNYEQKSAKTAILLSALFPGAGQFYVSQKSVLAYVFPVIEGFLWYSYFSNYAEGDDVTKKYEAYADRYYLRDRQHFAENDMMNGFPGTIYNDSHFRLDDQNSQHFYEDIAKYDKYVFGWEDWYATFVSPSGEITWIMSEAQDPLDRRWLGNETADGTFYATGEGSPLREDYIRQRKKAEDYYTKADNMGIFLVMNHLISTIDAARYVKKYNRTYHKTTSLTPKLETAYFNHQFTPMFNVYYKF